MCPYTHTHIAHSGVFFGAHIRTGAHPMCCYSHPVFFSDRPLAMIGVRGANLMVSGDLVILVWWQIKKNISKIL